MVTVNWTTNAHKIPFIPHSPYFSDSNGERL